jgi:DNA-binding response OmpR family regulator
VHRILVVEDDRPVRRLMVRALQDEGFAVLEAESGTDALHLLEPPAPPVDLLIVDVYLPGMNGAEVAARVRGLFPRPPVLFISGRLGDLGSENYLAKPFSMAELVSRVRDLLRL